MSTSVAGAGSRFADWGHPNTSRHRRDVLGTLRRADSSRDLCAMYVHKLLQLDKDTTQCLHTAVNETESITLVDLGNGTYRDMDPDPSTGDYVTDVVSIGTVTVDQQTIALLNHSSFPVSLFGMGFSADADGVKSGTFHEYKTYMENLKDQGVYDVAAYSVYLDPNLGPDDDPNTFPDGQLIIGGIDTGLMDGDFTTLPIVDDNSTEVSKHPAHFNLLLSAMRLGVNERNLVANSPGESCVISSGANALYVTNETYTNIVNSFPDAVFNKTLTLFEVPCEDRNDRHFEMSFEFIDPRSVDDAGAPKIQFTIPASEMVWPADRLFPGGDPRACAIAAYSIIDLESGESVGVPCSLGINMMKSGYWVFDQSNLEISFAPAARRDSRESNLVRLPEHGVQALFY